MKPDAMSDNRTYAETEIASFFLEGSRQSYEKNQILLDASEHNDKMFLLLQGYVKSYAIDSRGNQNIYMIYRPLDPFPITGMIDVKLPIYFEAMSDVEVTQSKLSDFNQFIESDSRITIYLLRRLVTSAASLTERLNSLQHTEARQRIIHNIAWLAKHLGKASEGGYLIDAPLTHQIIADSSNVSRETVSRQIQELADSGLLEYQRSELFIPDMKAFTKQADY